MLSQIVVERLDAHHVCAQLREQSGSVKSEDNKGEIDDRGIVERLRT